MDEKRIAVLRANAIGDFIFSLPAFTALRARFPRAEITLLGQPWHARFLSGRPGPIDRVVVIPPCRGLYEKKGYEEDPAQLEGFFEAMRKERFDVAVQLHGGGRYSNSFLRKLGAGLTVGLATDDAEQLDLVVPYVYFQHEVLRCLEVTTLMDAPPVDPEPRLVLTNQDLIEAGAVSPLTHAMVALHPGAGDPRRRWPPMKFAAIGNALAERGAAVVVTGIVQEKELVDEVVRSMKHAAINCCDRLSLSGLAGLYASCHLVVSNDSGPLHLARAVGARTVGIFWIGNLVNAASVRAAGHRTAVSWRLNCPVCGANCVTSSCGHRASFVADITVDEVAGHALELFDEAAAKRQ